MIKKIGFVFAGLFLLCSCQTGSSYRPIVRNAGVNYELDLRECQEFSKQRAYFNADAGVQAGTGAAIGGIAGALLGGGVKEAVTGAAIGGAFGAGSGAMEAKEQKKYIIIRCLREKGYNVYL